MNVKISPHKLSGVITAPVSKSEVHRILICSALSDSPVKLFAGRKLSDDISATINCLRSLGAEIYFNNDGFLDIIPLNVKNIPDNVELDCKESGSTLRFILPVATALCEKVKFKGCGRLPERPLTMYEFFRDSVVNNDKAPIDAAKNIIEKFNTFCNLGDNNSA